MKEFLGKRSHLEVSEEKTRVVNLRKNYSDFLGIKMKLRRKKGKLVVQSRVRDKALAKIIEAAKERVKEIAHPTKGRSMLRLVITYGTFVTGEHAYFDMATDVCRDFAIVAFHVNKIFKRIKGNLRKHPTRPISNAITKRYGESGQLRWLNNYPVAPIGYVKTSKPMAKKLAIQKYTSKGRAEIHANLGIDTELLKAMAEQPLWDRSVEYADCRLALYSKQLGLCDVTKKAFVYLDDIHCHHIVPRSMGGNDRYSNLTLVREDVHILIHATTQPTIEKYLGILSLTKPQLKKVNGFRKKVGNEPIIVDRPQQ